MDQPITPHVDLDPQPPIPLVVVYGAFPINSEAEKKWQTRGSQHGLSSLFIPYYFLVSFDKLSFPKKKPFRLCKNHFIS